MVESNDKIKEKDIKYRRSKEVFMNRLSRVVSIMIDLMNNKIVDTNYLAGKYEVSVRTIYRDIELLELSGIPIISEKGKHGGFSILEGFRIDKRILTEKEFSILLRGIQTLVNNKDKEAQAVYDKLVSILETSKKEKIIKYSNNVTIDISPFDLKEQINEYYNQLHFAIENRNNVKITYYSVGKGISTRVIEPLMLKFKSANWYVYAFCKEKQDYRYFKLARIKEMEILKEHFVEREIIQDEISNSFNDGKEIEIVLQTDKELSIMIQENYNIIKIEENDKFDLITIKYPLNNWIYHAILSFGDKAIVISPENIRNSISTMIKNMNCLYP